MGLPAHSRLRSEASYWVKSITGTRNPVAESVRRLVGEIARLIETAPPVSPAARPQRIAVMSGHGLNDIHLSCDALWLMALRQRGHHAMGIICDRGVPSCEFNFRGDGSKTPSRMSSALTPLANSLACRDCCNNALSALAATGAPIHKLSGFSVPGDLQDALAIAQRVPAGEIRSFKYNGVPVGDHAFSSTLRCTLRGVIDLDDESELWIYRRHLASSILLTDRLNRLIDRERPDKMMGVHGVYVMHGTMADVCKSRGIPAVIYGTPYRKGTVWLSHQETYHRSLVDEPTTHWDQDRLDDGRRQIIIDYLRSREVGGRDNINYHPNPVLDRQRIVDIVGLDLNKPIVTMFTNVVWDAQIYYPSNAFDNLFDWVFSTIDYFHRKPELQLVIRIHPAETKGGFTTRQPLFDEIMGRYPKLPPNVYVVRPESDVGSYTLAEMSKACLIFGTKMGLEIAYRGIPVIAAGESLNRGKGYTHDANTRQDYFALLDRLMDLPRNPPETRERALRFAYYLFFQKMIDMPLLGPNLWTPARPGGEPFYRFSTTAELLPGRCPELDLICDGILTGSPFSRDIPTTATESR
jgi:hypothetical protein